MWSGCWFSGEFWTPLAWITVLHVFPAFAWVPTGFSSFSSPYKNMHVCGLATQSSPRCHHIFVCAVDCNETDIPSMVYFHLMIISRSTVNLTKMNRLLKMTEYVTDCLTEGSKEGGKKGNFFECNGEYLVARLLLKPRGDKGTKSVVTCKHCIDSDESANSDQYLSSGAHLNLLKLCWCLKK